MSYNINNSPVIEHLRQQISEKRGFHPTRIGCKLIRFKGETYTLVRKILIENGPIIYSVSTDDGTELEDNWKVFQHAVDCPCREN